MKNPFAPSASRPGHGTIVLRQLPPSTPVLQTLSYQYPLKLIAPEPVTVYPVPGPSDAPTTPDSKPAAQTVHTVFLLTYGGGLVAGDTVDLHIQVDPNTRLILLTQGSTKIFKAPSRDVLTTQKTTVNVAPGASLVYLPDQVQPFAQSAFMQTQTYSMLQGAGGAMGNLCVCDWVSEGRSARGEKWDFYSYASRNEVYLVPQVGQGKDRLLLRDNMILDAGEGVATGGVVSKMDGMGVFGTLIIQGPLFQRLGKYFMDEFAAMPRIGARKWDNATTDGAEKEELSPEQAWRATRLKQEVEDGLLWTAASIRGFVLVKFGAREVEGARRWLRDMLRTEGTIEGGFGERALLCLK